MNVATYIPEFDTPDFQSVKDLILSGQSSFEKKENGSEVHYLIRNLANPGSYPLMVLEFSVQ